jgi:hypothetical protein
MTHRFSELTQLNERIFGCFTGITIENGLKNVCFQLLGGFGVD